MEIFYAINKNLYDIYFKAEFSCKNQYEYLTMVYCWYDDKMISFKSSKYDFNKISYQWMKNSMPSYLFNFKFDLNNEFINPESAFMDCYHNLKKHFRGHNYLTLYEAIRKLIFRSESEIKYKFKWIDSDFIKIKSIFENSETLKILVSLLIYAQTGTVVFPPRRYSLTHDMNPIKAYSKKVIDENLDVFIDGAETINMMQISFPSLLEEYRDFYKKSSRNAIINALESNPHTKLNMLFMNPDYPAAIDLIRSFMYGDYFGMDTKVIRDSMRFALELKQKFPNQVTAKKVFMPISYSIMQIIRDVNRPSQLKLDIYTTAASAMERSSIVVDNYESKELYDLYSGNFLRIYQSTTSEDVTEKDLE